MNVIKELWHGNIIPQEDSRTNSKEMKELLGYMARHHEDLEKTFTEEQKELIDECTWKWTNDYNGTGVAGRIVTSKTNDNHIFFPAAGYRRNSGLDAAGSYGHCWSSSLRTEYSDGAYIFEFYSSYVGWGNSARCYGLSVRGVIE